MNDNRKFITIECSEETAQMTLTTSGLKIVEIIGLLEFYKNKVISDNLEEEKNKNNKSK